MAGLSEINDAIVKRRAEIRAAEDASRAAQAKAWAEERDRKYGELLASIKEIVAPFSLDAAISVMVGRGLNTIIIPVLSMRDAEEEGMIKNGQIDKWIGKRWVTAVQGISPEQFRRDLAARNAAALASELARADELGVSLACVGLRKYYAYGAGESSSIQEAYYKSAKSGYHNVRGQSVGYADDLYLIVSTNAGKVAEAVNAFQKGGKLADAYDMPVIDMKDVSRPTRAPSLVMAVRNLLKILRA